NIQKYTNLQEFYKVIDSLLEEENNWERVTVKRLEALIDINLRLIHQQTETNTAQILRNKILKLSEQINEKFDTANAHNLAFRIQGIAQGLFSETKIDFTKSIPFEIQKIILMELTPKEVKVFKT